MADLTLVVVVLGVVGVVAVLYFVLRSPTSLAKVSIGNTTIEAEVADTWPKQVKGLMFRKSLPDSSGMLFVFDHDDYQGIWMANMSISLDILWIDSSHRVVDIVKDAPPCVTFPLCKVYKPSDLSRYVLEVGSGFADRHNVNVGDSVEF